MSDIRFSTERGHRRTVSLDLAATGCVEDAFQIRSGQQVTAMGSDVDYKAELRLAREAGAVIARRDHLQQRRTTEDA